LPADAPEGVGGLVAIQRVYDFATRPSSRRHAHRFRSGCNDSRKRGAGLPRLHSYPRPETEEPRRDRPCLRQRIGLFRTESRHLGWSGRDEARLEIT